MPTQCNTKLLELRSHGRRRVVADFDGGPITFGAGALLMRRVDWRLSPIEQVVDCFTDHRAPSGCSTACAPSSHSTFSPSRWAYEDLNDHDLLRHDPLTALFSEKGRKDSPHFAGTNQPHPVALPDMPDRRPLGRRFYPFVEVTSKCI